MTLPGRGTTGAKSAPSRSCTDPDAAAAIPRQAGWARSAPTSACPVSTIRSSSMRTATVPEAIRTVASFMSGSFGTVEVQRLEDRGIGEAEQVERAGVGVARVALGRDRPGGPGGDDKHVATRHRPALVAHGDAAGAVEDLK